MGTKEILAMVMRCHSTMASYATRSGDVAWYKQLCEIAAQSRENSLMRIPANYEKYVTDEMATDRDPETNVLLVKINHGLFSGCRDTMYSNTSLHVAYSRMMQRCAEQCFRLYRAPGKEDRDICGD